MIISRSGVVVNISFYMAHLVSIKLRVNYLPR